MTLGELVHTVTGFEYVVGKMELSGSRVRNVLYNTPFTTDESALHSEFDRLDQALAVLSDTAQQASVMRLTHLFYCIHDLHRTFDNLQAGKVLGETDFFEIKAFAFACRDFVQHMKALQVPLFDAYLQAHFPSLAPVVALLDPDKTGTVSFYLYDSYNPQLAAARAACKAIDAQVQYNAWEAARLEVERIELEVATWLSGRLQPFAAYLQAASDVLAYVEILFSKALLAKQYDLVRPHVSARAEASLQLVGMFHPQVADALQRQQKAFQPVDVVLHSEPCLLTGANMSGKTVVLKTLRLVQVMAQCGFFVPAQEARLPLVSRVFLVAGDNQDAQKGLSSFAAEMLALNRIFVAMKAGERPLVLVDEPARTTNPREGKALVCALVALLARANVCALITTHYGSLGLKCRKLRVIGFEESIDYRLTEDTQEDVPMEALRIARRLGIDADFLNTAEQYIS